MNVKECVLFYIMFSSLAVFLFLFYLNLTVDFFACFSPLSTITPKEVMQAMGKTIMQYMSTN